MRILTLNVDAGSLEPGDIEGSIQRLAASPDRLTAARGGMLLALVRLLQTDGPHPEAWGYVLNRELTLMPANPANRVSVRVWTDWRDYGPVRDGLPVLHYRMQIQRRSSQRTVDARADSPEEAKRIIYQAFGYLRE
jgi:hypothetical protein